MLFCDHVVSLEDFKIMASSNSEFHLKIKESLLIARDKPGLKAIWKCRNRHLGIGIAKKKFCLAEFLFLSFEVSYEENIQGEALFKYTCTPSWKFQSLFRAVIL